MWFAACLPALAALAPAPPARRWTPEEAAAWHTRVGRVVGCNYLPSTAVNDIEMWQAATFDPATIDRELGWARGLGLTSVRVFLNYLVWRDDPEGLKRRFSRFLALAAAHRVSVLPILFDDCNFAGRVAATGPQPPPEPGVHNSQWVSSPPLAMVDDRAAWPDLERYVTSMVQAFAADRRILAWDLYNEPGNSGMGARSLPLVEATFSWARRVRPSQPLTMGLWADFGDALSLRMAELSDVVSFHAYDTPAGVAAKLDRCAAYGRPILCTEWLFRQGGNTPEAILPIFLARKVACWSWGLVAGRTQTFYHWGSQPGSPEPDPWQHDLLRPDGTPYNPAEAAWLRRTLTGE